MDMNLRLDRLPTRGETRLGSGFFMMPGGKGANQAVAARRAGSRRSVFLTAFGEQTRFGREIRDRYFRRRGSTSAMPSSSTPTPRASP